MIDGADPHAPPPTSARTPRARLESRARSAGPVSPGGQPSADDDVSALLADPLFLTALKHLRQQFNRLAARLDKIQDVIDGADGAIADLIGRLPGAISIVPRSRLRPALSREAQGLMRAEADAGVSLLDIHHRADGSCDVRINGRPPFHVPPQPATLLSILVTPRVPADDGLVRWRTKTEVATALSKLTGHAVTPDDVTQILHKLRTAFRNARENVLLIDTHRTHGIRFALRPVIDGDPQ